jgi:hypothetical protein
MTANPWDYLIVTAGGERQARACEEQLRLRRELGLLAGVRDVLVVADPEGRRVDGFLLIVCKLPKHAGKVREMRDAEPPNDRARFFDFDISREGLVVTVC